MFAFLERRKLARKIESGRKELTAELAEFNHDGLVQLREHVLAGVAWAGTWDGCPLSYRLGGPASVQRDRKGRISNDFTQSWDAERIGRAELVLAVEDEMERRTPRPPTPEPQPAGV